MSENSEYDAGDQVDDVDQDDDAGTSGITSQEIAVQMNDGTSFVVQIQNRDYLSWDMTAPRQKWNAQAQPFLFANFLAYSAAKRTAKFAGTFDGREDSSWWNSVTDVDQRAVKQVPPTPPAAAQH